MNNHKNVEGDQKQLLAKFLPHHIFVIIQEWLRYTQFSFFHNVQESLVTQFYYFSNFKIPIANLDRKRFDF